MNAKKFKLFNDLSDANDKSLMLVRVIRKWVNYVFDKPLLIISLDLILQDEEGNKVHASIPKQFINCFDKKIKEYNWYQISKASFAPYSDNYKYVDNSHRLTLSKNTDVKLCDLFRADIQPFNFTTIDTLLSETIHVGTCIDVIGIIKDNGELKDLTKKNGNRAKKLEIDLYGSNGSKIGVTLWDFYATQIRSYIEQNPKEAPVVVLLHFAVYKPSDGKPAISNAINVTKLFINEDIPEIAEFKNRLVQLVASQPSASAFLGPPTTRIPFLDEFVNETDFKNILEVEDIKTPKKVIVCGSIMSSSNYNRWYYIGCQVCATMLKNDNKESHEGEIDGETSMNQFRGKYKCVSKKCNGSIVDGVARYRVPFDVQDSTGSLPLTLLEGQAVPLFKLTAMDLFKKLIENGADSDVLPKEIEDLQGQIYAFKINIQQYNINNKGSSYNIFRLTKDPNIITELQKKHEFNLEPPSDSSTEYTEDIVTLNAVDLSDKNDYVTPLEKNTSKASSASKQNKNVEPIKRKLQDVYDVDSPPQQSISKTIRSSNVQDSGKNTLLTPKKEK